ncbi:urease subunit beta [Candidatus Schneideria nysicola]|uniref:urease subunit beta n=1 Tax=Candidatus Schneideria nysicola TaxID=1081631 RepID=UPI001CAA7EA0|nr:urease subunit beta [Candidatus Schneideria nysicola]UAJ65219.1 urease subunit beta [Candidatus Schneideria nysicola]UAJ65756.1 urease subunit beta [Candidatus Schneideria nysicola]UAJ66284.1 urease subunit beta [Candidatus Schneideria nysicola]
MIPGEFQLLPQLIEINKERETLQLLVENHGDRPIQIGSHFHFYETNRYLKFDRKKTIGFRLHIPAGTTIRFEPGQSRKVILVQFSGKRIVWGFRSKIMGSLNKYQKNKEEALQT